VKSKTS